MIHFSLSPADANLVMKSLNLMAKLEKSFTGNCRNSADMKRILRVIRAARKPATHEQIQPTTQRIEEIHTREGIELCPVIS